MITLKHIKILTSKPMTRDSAKVTTKEGEIYEVIYKYHVTPKTHSNPQELELEIEAIYDEDGWEVTDTIDDYTREEVEKLVIENI